MKYHRIAAAVLAAVLLFPFAASASAASPAPQAKLILTQNGSTCTVSVTADAAIGSVQFTIPAEYASAASVATSGYSAADHCDDTFAYVGFSAVNDTFVAAGTADGIPANIETVLLTFTASDEPAAKDMLTNVESGMLDGETRFDCRIASADEADCGDVNGDGFVNSADAALLKKYLAGWDVLIDEAAADANGDGKINAKDSVLLRQYLAGWNMTLGDGDHTGTE